MLAGVAGLLLSSGAAAQVATGEIAGQVSERTSGRPLAGVTVVAGGPQGELATVSDDRGAYSLAELPVGTYTVRFVARSRLQHEQTDVAVLAAQITRVDARITFDPAPEEVHVVRRRAPAIDAGSSRVGLTLDADMLRNLPAGMTFGELLDKAPGAAVDASGGVSFAGGTGLENGYLLDGASVGGIRFGDLGTNLSSEFVRSVEIVGGGADAELGRALGGVANVITKSGSNELHGSVFGLYAPGWMAASPNVIARQDEAITAAERFGSVSAIGMEVGGPIIRDRLFFWGGFAPITSRTHVDRSVRAMVDRDGDGVPDTDAGGNPVWTPVDARRFEQSTATYQYGAKLDFAPSAEHRLTLSLFGTPSTGHFLGTANGDPDAVMGLQRQGSTDVMLRWMSRFLDRTVTLEGTIALHRETSHRGPANAAAADLNGIATVSGDLYALGGDVEGCTPNTLASRCPVTGYVRGGFGAISDSTANRLTAQLKSTVLFRLLGRHRLKLGGGLQRDDLTQTERYTGPEGGRATVVDYGAAASVITYYSLLPGEHGYDLSGDDVTRLIDAQHYRDAMEARTRSDLVNGFFQDSWSPVSGVTLNLGLRWEWQRLADSSGQTVIDIRDNIAPRLGAVIDPWRDGRTKLFGHFGRYYEALPLDLGVKRFAGTGWIVRTIPGDRCSQAPSTWTGDAGPGRDWRSCNMSGLTSDDLYVGSTADNAVVQPNLQGQHQDEIVAGLQRELLPDLVVGISYMHRALRTVIEDAAIDEQTSMIVNPGQVPEATLLAAQREADLKSGTPEGARAAAVARTLEGVARMPRPQRTYDGVTFTVAQRLVRGLMLAASYTYSRTEGNYTGLYDGDHLYRSPNSTSQYDRQVYTLNRFGPLPTDRPHIARVDGFYQLPLGEDTILTLGLGFRALSGQPVTPVQASPDNVPIFLLPRGSGGRTPFLTQLDARVSVRHRLSSRMWADLFVDLFNVLDQRTPTAVDQVYSLDASGPIVGGSPADLKYLTTSTGTGVTRNPNFGNAVSYQAPFSGRVGLRLTF